MTIEPRSKVEKSVMEVMQASEFFNTEYRFVRNTCYSFINFMKSPKLLVKF